MPVLRGIYQHFKGGKYRVHFIAHHSETLEPLVVYEALYEMADDVGPYFVRPLAMFTEEVTHEGTLQPRFVYVGEE